MPISFQKINGNFKGKDILSLDQFSTKDLEILFSIVPKMKKISLDTKPSNILAGTITTLVFFEPSSRTFNSFAAAAKQLGGQTLENRDMERVSSVAKGESLEDTVKTLESYCNCIVIRHPVEGSALKAAEAAFSVPVINAGDGGASHPTQALLDLYTIFERFKRLDNLTVLATGDVLHSRTIHSLTHILSLYPNNTMYLLSPKELRLSRQDFEKFSKNGIAIHEIFDEKDIPKNAQIWYWNRIQKERFSSEKEANLYKDKFVLTQKLLNTYGNKAMVILDPLPRVGEIELTVDVDPRSLYLSTQMRNGKYVRMALLALVLGRIP